MDLGSALIAMVSAVVVAGIGYATTKLTSSTQKKTAEVEALIIAIRSGRAHV